MAGISDRLASIVTNWSRTTIALMLVSSLLLGSGITEVESTASLEQFETGAEVADKQTYIEENFGSGEATTTTQIVIEGENLLAKNALLTTIRLQKRFRANKTVNETLTANPFDDFASVVAESTLRFERGEQLQKEASELQERAEQLNETRSELEERRDALETRADELNGTRERLETRREALQERAAELNETRAELEADREPLQERAAELNETRAELEADRESLQERAEELRTDAEELAAEAKGYKQRSSLIPLPLLGEDRKQEFEDRREKLVARQEELEADRTKLEQRAGALEKRATELEEDRAKLERRADALRERADALSEKREELERDASDLESAAAELEHSRDELKAKADELETRADKLEKNRQNLQTRRDSLANIELPLDERREQLESMNQSEIDSIIEKVLEKSDNDGGAHLFLPTDYELGSSSVDSKVLFITQRTNQSGGDGAGTSERVLKAQRAMGAILNETVDGHRPDDGPGGNSGDESGNATGTTKNGVGSMASARNGPPSETPTDTETKNGTVVETWGDSRPGEHANGGTNADQSESTTTVANTIVFSKAILSDEIDQSMVDSFVVVLPLSLLFVVIVLIVAYRDAVDIFLGLFGILTVLLWTFGFMGWVGIPFNQLMIAVPVFLVGLSIDFAIHVCMRHREESSKGDEGLRPAMGTALGGVGVALVWATATGAIGFLSNLTSSIQPIRSFGIVAAFGIIAAMIVFGLFIPAMKVELDELLSAFGIDRQKRAIGTEGGFISGFLDGGRRAALASPWAVVAVALLLTAGGVAGAVQLDTSFDQQDLVADEPADWMSNLPEPLAPDNYTTKEDMNYVNEHFDRPDTQARVLVEGAVANPDTLRRVDSAQSVAADQDALLSLPDGRASVTSPQSVMQAVAAENSTFNQSFVAADNDNDGVPDKNIEALYEELFAVAPDRAGRVIHRTDGGEYEALQLHISAKGDAPSDAVTEDVRTVAESIDGESVTATATGQLVVFDVIEDELFATVVQSLLVTLVAVFVFLMLGYRRVHDSVLLGFITLIPIVLSVTWILGTMSVLDIPFNVLTGTIASITIGLGIDYNIHMTERYMEEREQGYDVGEALSKSVRGTGGALFGSMVTTAGGFGILGFAILPVLQQFAIITSLTIVFAFFGSVFLLPSLLHVWTRMYGNLSARRASNPDSVESSSVSATTAYGRGNAGNGLRENIHERRLVYERLGLSGNEAIVFAALQSFQGGSTKRLADLTRLDQSTVSDVIETLDWYGLLRGDTGGSSGNRPISHDAAVAWLGSEYETGQPIRDEPKPVHELPPSERPSSVGAAD